MIIIAAGILLGVSSIAIGDIIYWNKDIASIFLGSRAAEQISLGLGITLIHYLIIGTSLLGVAIILRKKNSTTINQKQTLIKNQKTTKKSLKLKNKPETNQIKQNINQENLLPNQERLIFTCPKYFGYLSTRPKDSPIPQECINCQYLGGCMVAKVFL